MTVIYCCEIYFSFVEKRIQLSSNDFRIFFFFKQTNKWKGKALDESAKNNNSSIPFLYLGTIESISKLRTFRNFRWTKTAVFFVCFHHFQFVDADDERVSMSFSDGKITFSAEWTKVLTIPIRIRIRIRIQISIKMRK